MGAQVKDSTGHWRNGEARYSRYRMPSLRYDGDHLRRYRLMARYYQRPHGMPTHSMNRERNSGDMANTTPDHKHGIAGPHNGLFL